MRLRTRVGTAFLVYKIMQRRCSPGASTPSSSTPFLFLTTRLEGRFLSGIDTIALVPSEEFSGPRLFPSSRVLGS